MERGVHFQSEGGRTQAGVAGVRRKPFNTRRFPRHGRNSVGEFAERAGKSCHSAQKLPIASTKVSWVRFLCCIQLRILFCSLLIVCIYRSQTLIELTPILFLSKTVLQLVRGRVYVAHLRFIMHLFVIWTHQTHLRRPIWKRIGKS